MREMNSRALASVSADNYYIRAIAITMVKEHVPSILWPHAGFIVRRTSSDSVVRDGSSLHTQVMFTVSCKENRDG